MAAKITEIAEAVKTFVNGLTTTAKFNAERGVFGAFEVENLNTYQVRVWFGNKTVTPAGRCGRKDRVHGVYLTVQKRIDMNDAVAEVDRAMQLVEEIETGFAGEAMAGCSSVTPDVSILDDASFLADMLQRKHTFHHVIALAYREIS